MSITNNLIAGVDLPVWEWLRFNPAAINAALCVSTANPTGLDRFIYYLYGVTPTFWRYDTISDSWQQLASPNVNPSTVVSMKFAAANGFKTRALASSTDTVTMAGLNGNILVGQNLRIVAGTGAGQPDLAITSVSGPNIADQGVLTATTAAILTDSTKKWAINQWVGYQVRIVFDAGAAQIRNIIYNDATNLYLSDTNYQAIEPWNNTQFSSVTPFAIPVITAGTQSYYTIESSVVTVASNWTVAPDVTSKIVVLSGGIWLLSSAAASPFYTWQYYDIARDAWFTKTASGLMLPAALGTDCAVETFNEISTYVSSTATAGGAQTLTDSGQSWAADRWANYQVRINSGTGVGQRQRIVGNTGTVLTVAMPWAVQPTSSSTYTIVGDTDKVFISIGGVSTLYQYHTEADLWAQSDIYTYGITNNASATLGSSAVGPYLPIGITSIVRNTTGILTVTSAPTAGGTGYAVGDLLTVSGGGGTNGKVRVVTTTTSGAVATIALSRAGSGYSTGSGLTTTGGTGSGCTIAIATVGNVGLVTTAINHNFQIGNTVTLAGFATDATFNATFTVLGVDQSVTPPNLFEIAAPSSTASPTIANSNITTLMVDSSQNWATNSLVGLLVHTQLAGTSGASAIRRITANTATTITFQSALGSACLNGTGRYIIYSLNAFGRDEEFRVSNLNGRGYCTGSASTTTLVDSTKSWYGSQWVNYNVMIISGTGAGNIMTVTANNSTTLTYATQSFTPDTSSKYILLDAFGLATSVGSTTTLTDSTKNWTANQWAGKRIKITSGTGQGQDASIVSNTATVITFSAAVAVAPSTDSTYTIISSNSKGTGTTLRWANGNSNTAIAGKYIWAPIGGGATRIDAFDITTGLWNFGQYMQPITETLTTGSQYCYDGGDRLYFTTNATGRIFFLNLTTMQVFPCGITPYAHGTGTTGNRMEYFKNANGLQFIWIMRQSGQEVWRTLVFW